MARKLTKAEQYRERQIEEAMNLYDDPKYNMSREEAERYVDDYNGIYALVGAVVGNAKNELKKKGKA